MGKKTEETLVAKAAEVTGAPAEPYVKMSDRDCTFQGCIKKAVAVGLCYGHYRQRSLGHDLKPIREKRDLQKLPVTLRVESWVIEGLQKRIKAGNAPSMYEACRQALEAGVTAWNK